MQDSFAQTQQWLEERFRRGVSEGRYYAHRPIYGFGVQPSERNHTARMALAMSILRALNRVNGETLMDLGGGEGYMAALARDILGFNALLVEWPESACQRGRELFGLPAQSADILNLPFADDSVDVTILSEVIEHLHDPVRGLAETYRITRQAMIVTTAEAVPWEWERRARMRVRDLGQPHAERTIFHRHDFRAMFGTQVEFFNPCLVFPLLDETMINEEQARALVPQLAQARPYGPGSLGFLALILKRPDAGRVQPRLSDRELVDALFRFRVPLPNVSRATEAVWPEWVQKDTPGRPAADPYAPLSQRWTAAERKRIMSIQEISRKYATTSRPRRMLAQVALLSAAILRLLLAPGNFFAKIPYAMRHLRKRYLRKVIAND